MHTILRQHYIATRISRSAIFWSVSPWSSLRASRKVQRVGLVHCTDVTGDGGLQEFPGVADVIDWKEGKRLHPLEHVVTRVCRNKVLSQYSAFTV